jgi:hypothetical protein
MTRALLQSLFVQVTVPVVLTQLFGMWMNKRAFDRLMRRSTSPTGSSMRRRSTAKRG